MTILERITQWLGRIPKRIRKYISTSLHITTTIKKWLDNPIADFFTELIPGTVDNAAKAWILALITEALPYLMIVDTCKDKQNAEEMVKCWIEELRKQPKPVQHALFHKLAALLTAIQDDHKLKQRYYDLYTQLQFTGEK